MKTIFKITLLVLILLGFVYVANTQTRSLQPLTLTAVLQEDQVELGWTATSETDDYVFTVEKTTDMLTFETVASVNGNLTTDEIHNYTVPDTNPYTGISYYRLKRTDANGATETGEPIIVKVDINENSLKAYPNPATQNLTVLVHAKNDETVTICLFNAGGGIVYTQNVVIENNRGMISLNQVSSLPAGIYTLMVSGRYMHEQQKIVVMGL